MAAATDPIAMVQRINILGDGYVVWDKAGEIRFRRPAREEHYAPFTYTAEELTDIRARVAREGEIDIVNASKLTDRSGTVAYAEVQRMLYIARKTHYRAKQKHVTPPDAPA